MENNVEIKEKMLLHSCCSVCSSHVISVLAPEYDLSVFYYNPNIWPEAEYEHRKAEQIRLLREADFCEGVGYFDLDYDHGEFLDFVRGLEKEPENGARCRDRAVRKGTRFRLFLHYPLRQSPQELKGDKRGRRRDRRKDRDKMGPLRLQEEGRLSSLHKAGKAV